MANVSQTAVVCNNSSLSAARNDTQAKFTHTKRYLCCAPTESANARPGGILER